MKTIALSVLAALAAQFISLPFLIGGRGTSGAEMFGWTMILAIFFAIPSLVVYFVMFAGLRLAPLPGAAIIALSALIPALIVFAMNRGQIEPIANNYVLWMGVIGGATGGFVLAKLTGRLGLG